MAPAELLLGSLLAASCAYSAALLIATSRRSAGSSRSSSKSGAAGLPRVSVLKPAVGAGPEFAGCLRSHAGQDYPAEREILVGALAEDRAVPLAVQAVRREFPALRVELVECPGPAPGSNGKVEVLERLAAGARFRTLVATDADIEVPRHHLRAVCRDLQGDGVGLVTCLYRAEPGTGTASRLQATRINADFAGQVLLAGWLQPVRFALGATYAVRAGTLGRLGGFGALRHFVGEDYQLGAKVAGYGQAVRISSVAVATLLPGGDGWTAVWRREVRWSRTIRKQRPVGHAGLPVTFGTVWCCLGLAAGSGELAVLSCGTALLRILSASASARQVGVELGLKELWLLAAADLWASAAWLASYFGSTVHWGGRSLRLGPGGRIVT